MFGNAEAYERFMGRWSRLVAPRLVEFSQLPESGRVLDVGSGTGSLAFAIAGQNPRVKVLGIDPSKEYVAYAAAKSAFGERTAFEVGDAQQLSYPDGSFDSAVSLLVWNFIPDPAKALREVTRVTKLAGPVSAAVWDYADGMRMLRIYWDAAASLDAAAEKLDEKHMRLCRQGELAHLWEQAGLRNVEEQPIEVTTRFQSFADYWEAFLLGQGPAGAYAVSLDRAKQHALHDALKRRLALANDNQAFALPARVWAVRGVVA